MAYDAFISYSHAADETLAPLLQDVMQRVAKPWYRRRALHVFRDDSGLSANPALWTSITTVLDETEWFVLLASPEAAASAWVNREIEHWLAHRDRSHMLMVLTSGTLTWDEASRDFDPATSTALPPALQGAFDEEPKHLDMTWAHHEPGLGLRTPRLRDQGAALAAPVHGVAKDELEGADLREHRRTVRLVRAVAVVLVVLAVAAGLSAVAATRNARRATDNARRARTARDESDYRRVVAESRDLRTTNRTLALLLAVEARHIRDTPQSRNALEAALVAEPRFLEAIGDGTVGDGSNDLCLAGRDRLAVTAGFDGTVGVIDLRTGRPTGARLRLPGTEDKGARRGVHCATSADQRHTVVTAAGRLWALDVPGRRVVGRGQDLGGSANQVSLSPDGTTVMVGTFDGRVLAGPVDPGKGALRTLTTIDRPPGVAFSSDDRTAISTTRTEVVVWDTTTWTVARRIEDLPDDQASGFLELPEDSRRVEISPDGRFIGDSRRAVFRVFEAASGRELWRTGTTYASAAPFTFSGDSRSVLAITTAEGFEPLDVRTGKKLGPTMDTQEQGFVVPASTADGSTLVVAASGRSLIQRWSLDGRTPISRRIDAPNMIPNGFSPDGSALLAIPQGKSAVVPSRAYDVASGRVLAQLPTAVLPTLLDRETFAGFLIDELKVTRIRLDSGMRTGPSFEVDISHVNYAAVDRRGRILIGNSDGTVDRYEADGTRVGTHWLRLPTPITYLVISPTLDLVAFMDNGGATRVVRMSDGKILRVLRDFTLPAFTADGKLLTGFSTANEFRFVDARTGTRVGPTVPITGRVTYSDFAASDVFVLAGPTGAQVYDLETRKPITDFFPSTGAPVAQPGGSHLATSTDDGIVLWDLDPDHWEAAACTAAGRNLTRQEWAEYFPNAAYRESCPS